MRQSAQSGQTIVETLIAIFMLTVAMIGTLATLQYVLQSSDQSVKQTTALGLAAEGIEIIRNTRDSNWLADTLVSSCDELKQNATDPNEPCYPNWLKGTAANGEKLRFRDYAPYVSLSGFNFNVDDIPGSSGSYALRYAVNSVTGVQGYVNYSGSACAGLTCAPTIYSRKVTLTDESTISGLSGSLAAKDPIVKIVSTVWWQGRDCPQTDNPSTLRAKCRVIITDYLTNWKNY